MLGTVWSMCEEPRHLGCVQTQKIQHKAVSLSFDHVVHTDCMHDCMRSRESCLREGELDVRAVETLLTSYNKKPSSPFHHMWGLLSAPALKFNKISVLGTIDNSL